jgi:hypothetical protein
MYVIIYKNRVILGALPWNATYFMRVLQSRYRVLLDIPLDEPLQESFPMVLNSDFTIKRAIEEEKLPMNPYVEQYYGPQWDVSEQEAKATYEVRDLPLDEAKSNFYGLFARERYEQEVSGTNVTIFDNEYTIQTDRESRSSFLLALANMNETSTVNWKFKEGWVELNKEQFQQILRAINSHVQECFSKEMEKIQLVMNCSSKQELLDLDLLPKKTTEFE